MSILNNIPAVRYVIPDGVSSAIHSKFITSFPGRDELMFWKTYSPYVVNVTFDFTTIQGVTVLHPECCLPASSNRTQNILTYP